MRHHGRIIWVRSALLSTAFVSLFLLSPNSHADTHAGNLAVVNGDVRIAKNKDDKGRQAKPSDPISNNDIVKTGDGASAKLLFTDQSIMDVGPNSALKVSDYALGDGENRTGTFSLFYGKLRALVTKKVGPKGNVQVRSNDAVMGVRGTEFVVNTAASGAGAGGSGTSIMVVSGSVAVAPPMGGPPISIGAGQMMVATPQAFAQASPVAGPGGPAGGKRGQRAKGSAQGDAGSAEGGTADAGGGDAGGPATADAGAPDAGGEGSGPQIVEVSAEQMQSAVSSAKAEDNTFVAAVEIAPSSGDGSSGGGSMTMATVTNLVAGETAPPPPSDGTALPPPPPPPTTTFLPPVNIIPGNQVQLTIGIQ